MSRRLLLRLLASAPPATDHVADAELLRRFVASNDSAAFELVARRHADAVWATCRRTLRSEADAEDAFQATFLALIRKAKTISAPCVGGWLHRVAVNASLKLRERAARSSPLEPNQLDAIPAPFADRPDTERAVAVHEELARLPERDRLPVVLCDLEGLSHADAAKALGWPIGTVSGRLSRARAKLRDRLARRGLTPTAALLPALTAPPHLISSTLNPTAASPAVVSLTEGVLAMNVTATWKWVAVAVCAGAFGAGAVLAFGPGEKGAPANAPPEPVPAENPAPPAGAPVWMSTDAKDPVPTEFPKLLALERKGDDDHTFQARLVKACPKVLGDLPIADGEVTDRYAVLLMTQLQQGRFEIRHLIRKPLGGDAIGAQIRCLTAMRALVLELWAKDQKRLTPWLEEFVVLGKTIEQFAAVRVAVVIDPPRVIPREMLFVAHGHRVAAEAALWKATNAK